MHDSATLVDETEDDWMSSFPPNMIAKSIVSLILVKCSCEQEIHERIFLQWFETTSR